jgi:hypothetical protein
MEKYVDADRLGDFWLKNRMGTGSWTYINKKVVLDKCSNLLN